jgi:hypothetical protein
MPNNKNKTMNLGIQLCVLIADILLNRYLHPGIFILETIFAYLATTVNAASPAKADPFCSKDRYAYGWGNVSTPSTLASNTAWIFMNCEK